MKILPLEVRERTRQIVDLARSSHLDYILLTAPENIYYFSGFRTTLYTRVSGVLFSAAEGVAHLMIPRVEARLALDPWWSPTWYSEDQVLIYGPKEPCIDHVAMLKRHIPAGSSVGLDAMVYPTYAVIEAAIPGLKAVPVYDAVNAMKQIKNEAEMAALARVNEIAVKGLGHVHQFLTEKTSQGLDVTELDIAIELDLLAKREGCDGHGYPTLVSFGQKMLAPHSPPLRRIIPRGQVVRVAFGPAYDGYSGDVIRTFVIGDPPASVRRLCDAFLEAQQEMFAVIKPGVSSPELLQKVRALYDKRGVAGNWSGNIGHGIGITIHEPPRISAGDQSVLNEGMVVAIEPSLEGAEGGYAHCDVVRVTKTGCEVLSPGLFDLQIIKG